MDPERCVTGSTASMTTAPRVCWTAGPKALRPSLGGAAHRDRAIRRDRPGPGCARRRALAADVSRSLVDQRKAVHADVGAGASSQPDCRGRHRVLLEEFGLSYLNVFLASLMEIWSSLHCANFEYVRLKLQASALASLMILSQRTCMRFMSRRLARPCQPATRMSCLHGGCVRRATGVTYP